MSSRELRNAVRTKREVEVQIRPPLYASVCDNCGTVFKMPEWCTEEKDGFNNGLVHGTFDQNIALHGNMFAADVCSFACADQLTSGGWKKLERYKVFKEAGAKIARAAVRITELVLEPQLVAEWEKVDHMVSQESEL